MHGEPWGGVLAAGAHVRTVRICRILASHVARLAGQIVHEGGRVEQSKLGRATVSARPHDGMPSRHTARMVAAKRLEGLLEAPSTGPSIDARTLASTSLLVHQPAPPQEHVVDSTCTDDRLVRGRQVDGIEQEGACLRAA